jgi:signal transduction histidine kinase
MSIARSSTSASYRTTSRGGDANACGERHLSFTLVRLSLSVAIVVLEAASAHAIRAHLAHHADVVLVVRENVPVREAVAAARAARGPIPVGVIARTAPEAIDAIEAGADEALAIDPESHVAVLELIDRTRMRGTLRRASERERAEVAQAEKLASLGTLVAGVAHEINNPLGALTLLLDMLPAQIGAAADVADVLSRAASDRRGLTHAEVARVATLASLLGTRKNMIAEAEQMATAARTIRDVVVDLLAYARVDEEERIEQSDLHVEVESVLRLLESEIEAIAIIERDYGLDLPPVLVRHSRLTQVLTNVLVNAIHAMREHRREVHRLRLSSRADDSMVALSIADTGGGIPPEAVERIFDPFFSTKRANLGTGLGLTISRDLMRKMGGDLLVDSVHGEGATFIVLIPRPSPAELRAAARRVPATLAVSTTRRVAVMVVGDDENLVRAYSRVLGRRYDVLLAADSDEAIEMLRSGSQPDVVLGDLAAREVGNLQQWLAEHRAALASRAIFVSDDPGSVRNVHGMPPIEGAILTKPTPTAVLLRAIEEAAAR